MQEAAVDSPGLCDGTNSKEQRHETENVLVVPKRLTKTAQNIVFSRRASPMAYHLEGRWGSRTFQVDSNHMGLPILEKGLFLDLASRYEDLHGLLQMPGVEQRDMPYVQPPKHRARESPYFDATIHPERAPIDFHLEDEVEKAKHIRQSTRHEQPVFTYAELFAGSGGFGVALDALGGRCLFCSELEEHLQAVYKHNFVTIPNQQQQNHHPCETCAGSASAGTMFDIPIYGDICQVPDSAFPKTLDLLVAGK